MMLIETGKVLVDKNTGARFDVVKVDGVGEEGVKSVEFWGGVTSCNDPIVYLSQIVLENFHIIDKRDKDSMVIHVVKVGSKYYGWNNRLGRMTLQDSIYGAYKYTRISEAEDDIKYMEELGLYKKAKKRILKAVCDFKEVE